MSRKRALVVGNVNLETSLKLDAFPVPDASSYQPGRLELNVSGVGYNVARALQVLATPVRLASVVGPDTVGNFIRAELERQHFNTSYFISADRTGRSSCRTRAVLVTFTPTWAASRAPSIRRNGSMRRCRVVRSPS